MIQDFSFLMCPECCSIANIPVQVSANEVISDRRVYSLLIDNCKECRDNNKVRDEDLYASLISAAIKSVIKLHSEILGDNVTKELLQ